MSEEIDFDNLTIEEMRAQMAQLEEDLEEEILVSKKVKDKGHFDFWKQSYHNSKHMPFLQSLLTIFEFLLVGKCQIKDLLYLLRPNGIKFYQKYIEKSN
jgi:hypothetical protein